MKKFYLFFILFSLSFSFSVVTRAQEAIQETAAGNPATNNTNRIVPRIQNLPLPVPIMQNTGNPEKDSTAYAIAKEKWIDDVLNLYGNKFTREQKNKFREILRKENLEDVLKGKIFIAE